MGEIAIVFYSTGRCARYIRLGSPQLPLTGLVKYAEHGIIDENRRRVEKSNVRYYTRSILFFRRVYVLRMGRHFKRFYGVRNSRTHSITVGGVIKSKVMRNLLGAFQSDYKRKTKRFYNGGVLCF